MLRHATRPSLSVAALLLGLPSAGGAQQDVAMLTCKGEIVSRVDIQPSPPPFAGAAKKWQAAARSGRAPETPSRTGSL